MSFSVSHYNILASWLGSNYEPWFLYGASKKTKEVLLDHFNNRKNVLQWPDHVVAFLKHKAELKGGELVTHFPTKEEEDEVIMKQVEHFAWDKRKHKIVELLKEMDSEIISLVEFDARPFFRTSFPNYTVLSSKRPDSRNPLIRKSDGSALLIRDDVFDILVVEELQYGKHVRDSMGRFGSDRIALFAFLQHYETHKRLLVVSTHLMREPDDREKTKIRLEELRSLVNKINNFLQTNAETDEEVAIIIAGDFNATPDSSVIAFAKEIGFRSSFEPCYQYALL